MEQTDARTITTKAVKLDSDHATKGDKVETVTVSLASDMVSVLNALSDAEIRSAAIEHAADHTCPYPHVAIGPDACPTLASYINDDRTREALRERAERERQEIAERHEAIRAEQERAQQAFRDETQRQRRGFRR